MNIKKSILIFFVLLIISFTNCYTNDKFDKHQYQIGLGLGYTTGSTYGFMDGYLTNGPVANFKFATQCFTENMYFELNVGGWVAKMYKERNETEYIKIYRNYFGGFNFNPMFKYEFKSEDSKFYFSISAGAMLFNQDYFSVNPEFELAITYAITKNYSISIIRDVVFGNISIGGDDLERTPNSIYLNIGRNFEL